MSETLTTATAGNPVRARGRHRAAPAAHHGGHGALASGVYGTLLAGALLVALQTRHDPHPVDDAAWIVLSAAGAAVLHAYAQDMGAPRRDMRHMPGRLAAAFRREWPLVASALPTAALLLAAAYTPLTSDAAVMCALVSNTALLFAWGVRSTRRHAGGWRSAILTGLLDAAIGLGIITANAAVK